MPNRYKRQPGSRSYRNFSDETLQNAITELKNGNSSYRQVSAKYEIPISTLCRKYSKKNMKKWGGQISLTSDEEGAIVSTILYAGDWGYPFESVDVRLLVKSYLDRQGKKIKKFNKNLPGHEWYNLFIKRHSSLLKPRLAENIKRSRAAVSRTVINAYFDNLAVTLENIPPQNIVNYDETNFIDDPGRTKVLIRKNAKHADSIMDSSKSATSVMFCVDASGGMLPPYVVYKSLQMWEPWTLGGPDGCRYNRSPSGWFDQSIFEDWFQTIIIPHFRRLEGTKVVIGDNLASHISVNIVKLCKQQNIKFVFLPANSTHLTQPLDVSCFRPMKIAWRKVLKEHKLKKRGRLTKDIFPKILKSTIERLNISQKDNIKSGFEATGIYPLDRQKVLNKLPDNESPASIVVPQAMHDMLKESRFGSNDGVTKKGRRKKYNVEPGRSVTEANMTRDGDNEQIMETDQNDETEDNQINTIKKTEENKTDEDDDYLLNQLNDFIEINFETDDIVFEKEYNSADETVLRVVELAQQNQYAINFETHDFVLVKFETLKGNFEEFVGQISEIDGEEITCKFLRKSKSMSGYYVFPFIIDEATVTRNQIIRRLKLISEKRGNYQFEWIVPT
ncbi:unnamed protein product [Macrosiphum euphorbiae]|uniref:DDE-1 domain-containing protein n=2 Tax=Macrosiphum euphorbiae TaxID=13131 RepID=A0AAV0WPG5_9HEMI|nr:unnamed protein product [Macrosiphum euphorbiae]